MWITQENKNLKSRKHLCLKGKSYLAVCRWKDTRLCLLSTVFLTLHLANHFPTSPAHSSRHYFTKMSKLRIWLPAPASWVTVTGARCLGACQNSACVNIRNLLVADSHHPSFRRVSIQYLFSSRQSRSSGSFLTNKINIVVYRSPLFFCLSCWWLMKWKMSLVLTLVWPAAGVSRCRVLSV